MNQDNVDNVTASRSWGSVVDIVTRVQGAGFGVQLLAKAGDIPFPQTVQNGSDTSY
jgi:hypothetical protein